MFRKIFVCIVIFLFFGASFVICINGDISGNKNTIQINESTCFQRTDWWPMFRHDPGHSGYSTSQAPNTNISLWNYTAGSSIDSSCAIVDGKVYFGSSDSNIYCLDAGTGVKIWQYSTGYRIYSSPAVYESKVYFGSTNSPEINGNKVFCLDATTGEKLWEFAEGYSTWGAFSSPVVSNGKVYVGSGDKKLYCLDALTGEKLWDYLTDDQVISSPALAYGKVYFGSQDQFVYCLDAETGAEIWSYSTYAMITSSPAVVDGKVYIGSDKMYCLNADTGALIWQRSPSFYFSSPAVYNDKVYVCDIDDKLYCLSSDNGLLQWQYEPGPGITDTFSSPMVADGKVYLGSSDGNLYCLDAETEVKIWDYLIDYYPIFSSPTVAGGRLYIGGMSGILYCFGEANNPPSKPNIYGPQNGTTNVEYTFCTDTITDPEGDSIYCLWDWGDGNLSGWLGPFASGQTICASRRWAQPGIYCIMLKLKDDYGMESEWSDPFCITIVENQHPSSPSIDGPTHVKVGVETSWGFISIDPEGENITYYVDWGDKCGGAEYFGPYPSGQKINLSHKYTKKNTLIINALAIDSQGAESNLSYFEVEISRNKAFINKRLLLQFFERFICYVPILKYISR